MRITSLLAAALVAFVPFVTRAGDEAKKDEVEFQGTIGCSHCDYHKGDSCGVGFKTADDKVYILEKAEKKWMKARTKRGDYKVSGKVTEKDGNVYVIATKIEAVK